jgi:cytochrome c556
MAGRALLLVAALLAVARTSPAQKPKLIPEPSRPKLEAVAETRLVMEGLAQSNFRGLDRLLSKEKPADPEAWKFARGQALLLAETGNLLMLRPPRSQGQDLWMQRSTELREVATNLARATAARDWDRSRAGLREVADTCNRCHQSFRINVQVAPGMAE